MRRKQAYLLWTAAGAVLGIGAVNAHATPTATLSINASGGNWTAYVSLDSASDNVGLATFAIDVDGSNGINVTSSTLGGPANQGVPISKGAAQNVGFTQFLSSGTDGVGITAGQNVAYGNAFSASTNPTIVVDVSKTGAPVTYSSVVPGRTGSLGGQNSSTGGAPPQTTNVRWTDPTAVATGKYSGTSGQLSVVLDTSEGQGIQSLNNNGSGAWTGPGNLSFDIVIPGSVLVGGSTPPRITLTGTSLVGSDDLSGATVTPSSDDVNDVITESGGHGSDSYDAIHIHEPGNGVSNGGFQFAGFHQGDNIDVLLKFSNLTTGTDPVTGNAQLLSDIENYINANDGTTGISVGVVPAALAADFPGTSYDLLLNLPSPTTDPFADFDFSAFSGDGLSAGQLGLSDIGVVPEPASLGLLMLGGIGLVGRRRKKDSK